MKRITLLSTLLFAVGFAVGQTIVINEIDYDQSGTDNAEFIELKNTGSSPVNLNGYYLFLISGGGTVPSVYDSITLPSFTLSAGAYYVICGDTANVKPCHYEVSPSTNLIQNGGSGTSGPDAVALHHPSKTRMDVVSYEGSLTGYVEVSGNGIKDNPNNLESGISRIPDGMDTQNNDQDFRRKCISPGAANLNTDTNCVVVTSVEPQKTSNGRVTISPNPSNGTIFFSASKGNPSRIEVIDWTGKTVKKSPFRKSLDLTTLPSGMYFVRTYFTNNVQVDKVILR